MMRVTSSAMPEWQPRQTRETFRPSVYVRIVKAVASADASWMALHEAPRVRDVFLEVRADNPAAQSLYERAGFSVITRRRGYYQPSGTDALVMRVRP